MNILHVPEFSLKIDSTLLASRTINSVCIVTSDEKDWEGRIATHSTQCKWARSGHGFQTQLDLQLGSRIHFHRMKNSANILNDK